MSPVINNTCIVIPHFEHHRQFKSTIARVLDLGYPVVVVDDGSSEQSYAVVRDLVQKEDSVHLTRHARNKGKGAAVQTGFRYAFALGFTHAVQIDADGQHAIEDVPGMVRLMQASPLAVVCGLPEFDHSIPAVRYYAKKLTDWWVNFQTMSTDIADSMCGFRGYPLITAVGIMDRQRIGNGMDFDVDIIVHAYWAGVPLRYMRTKVTYPVAGISHFHYLKDNIVMTRLHFRLAFGMLFRLPRLIRRRRAFLP